MYPEEVIEKVRLLRTQGLTYREINISLGLSIPKSSLSFMCKNVDPGDDYRERIQADTLNRLVFVRELAVRKNKQIFENKLAQFKTENQHAKTLIKEYSIAKIALAMLYLGEGGKWKGRRGLYLGSSDPRIMNIYINLLKECYGIKGRAMRGRIQHRADQDGQALLEYWSKVTKIPKEHFYPNYVDKRTEGRVTKKRDYKGVCVVTCPGTNIQLELDIIADIISSAWGISSVG